MRGRLGHLKIKYLVNVVLRERGGISVDGPVLGIGQGLLLAQSAQVHLAATGRVVASGAADVAPLAVPERGLWVVWRMVKCLEWEIFLKRLLMYSAGCLIVR